MSVLKVIDRDGVEHEVPARAGLKIMCSCATCHVYIDEPWAGQIPAPMSDEMELLQELAHYKSGSRLSCQVDMTDELDGMRVTIAPDE
jgi:2Fe-2S ferredoxin